MKCPICIGIDVPKNKLKKHLEDDYCDALCEKECAEGEMDKVLEVAKKLKIKLNIK